MRFTWVVLISFFTAVAVASEVGSGSGGGSSSSGSGVKMEEGEKSAPATTNSDTVSWDGCKGNFKAEQVNDKGGSKDGCGVVKQMDKHLFEAMNKVIPYCFERAGKNGNDAIKNLKVDHVGCFVDRNKNVPGGGSTEKSEHAFGRAIDLKAIHIDYSSGAHEDYNFDTTTGPQRDPSEIDQFRKCWSESTLGEMGTDAAKAMALSSGQKLCGGGGKDSANHVSGSLWSSKKSQLDPKNSLHDNHLHIECLEQGK